MEIQSVFININSTDPARLYAFYRDVVGLPVQEGMGEMALQFGPGATIGFDGHSEVTGPAKDAPRVLLNGFVADVKSDREAIEARGGRFIRKEGVEFWGGVISTLVDPDGNYFQLITYNPESAQGDAQG
jgi:predicted enzyme related to lactoylglutathione lyase